MKQVTAAILVCTLPMLGAIGCSRGNADPTQEVTTPTVTVVQPQRADMVRAITLPGDLVGYYQADLYGKVSGYLKSINVDKGDAVKAGQVLAEIEVPELQQKLRRARANLEVKRRTFDRLQNVWNSDKRLVAREDVDIAEGQFEEGQAEVEELEALVSYTRIVAPFDGVVTGRFVDPGALIQASGSQSGSAQGATGPSRAGVSPVVSLADLSKLRVYIYLPEDETSLIRVGMPATLTLREFPGRQFTGTVTRFSKALDLATRTMLTEVDLDNPNHELYPGMYADVSLELARHPDVLQVPVTAVETEKGRSFVYVVKGDRLARLSVTTGLATPNRVEVASGLTGTESVVKNFSPALRDGEKVQPLMQQAEAVASASH
ncbi:MAG TPA: efflux RND transporter periplasmic adaptor subunit [Candidatus Margulisiibacteriota bacterium]|nr:efflux RND transporter periplasmic adaptor subunit [Candidatus Margulisiibacteriota bacterium]